MNSSIGHNGFIEPADWAWEAAQSKAHSFVKLIVHTIRCLVRDGEQEANVTDGRLAELTSMDLKTVRKYRKIAHDEGWVRHSAGRGRGVASTYQMNIPSRTLAELATGIDIAKKRDDRGTFMDPKVTPERVPLQGKVPPERIPLEENYPSKGHLSEPLPKNVPPHPPKNNNYNIPPVVPQKLENGVEVNCTAIHVRIDGRHMEFDYGAIDMWAALANCPADKARGVVEGVSRGWVIEGKYPDAPTAMMRRQISKWRLYRESDNAEIKRKAGAPSSGSSYSMSGNYTGKLL